MSYQDAVMVLEQQKALSQMADMYAVMFFMTFAALLAIAAWLRFCQGTRRPVAYSATESEEMTTAPEIEMFTQESMVESDFEFQPDEEGTSLTENSLTGGNSVFVEFEEWFRNSPVVQGVQEAIAFNAVKTPLVQMPLPIHMN